MTFQRQSRTNIIPISRGINTKISFMNEKRKMITFKELQEGVYDPNIFKAFFLAGGHCSGKSYVVARTTKMFGMRVVNSDDVFEKLVKT